MSEEELNEYVLRDAFKEMFSDEYIQYLEDKSTAKDNLVEVLWLGFCRGYQYKKSEK